MDKIYLMKLCEIVRLEKEFVKKPKVLRALAIRNKLRDLVSYPDGIPEEDLMILRPRSSLYNEYPKGDIATIYLVNKIKSIPLPIF